MPSRTVAPSSRRAAGSRGAVFEVRALDRDLAVLEREDVAAVDLDLLAIGGRAGEGPLRHAAVARDEMARSNERCVRENLEHPYEHIAHTLAPRVPRASAFSARVAPEHLVVCHEGHPCRH